MSNNGGGGGVISIPNFICLSVCQSVLLVVAISLIVFHISYIHAWCLIKKYAKLVYNWIKSISKAISILIYTEVHIYPQFMIEEGEGWSNESICDTDVRMSDCIQINNQVSLKKVKKNSLTKCIRLVFIFINQRKC